MRSQTRTCIRVRASKSRSSHRRRLNRPSSVCPAKLPNSLGKRPGATSSNIRLKNTFKSNQEAVAFTHLFTQLIGRDKNEPACRCNLSACRHADARKAIPPGFSTRSISLIACRGDYKRHASKLMPRKTPCEMSHKKTATFLPMRKPADEIMAGNARSLRSRMMDQRKTRAARCSRLQANPLKAPHAPPSQRVGPVTEICFSQSCKPAQIRKLRQSSGVSQAVFVHLLGVSVILVKSWKAMSASPMRWIQAFARHRQSRSFSLAGNHAPNGGRVIGH